jgi:colanic acid biosynthesis glycosyl transferase WcaI
MATQRQADRVLRMSGVADAARAKPRVVFVNRFGWPDISATSQLLSDLTADLAAAGYPVEVVCSRLRYEGDGPPLAPVETHAGVTIRRLWSARFGRARLAGRALDYLSFYCSAALHLLRDLRAGDIVVAKTDPPLLSVVVAAAAGVRGARLVNWLQDLFPEVAERLGGVPLPRPMHALLRGLRNWSLRRARCNVVLGDRMRQELLANGIEPARVAVSANWCDGAAVQPLPVSASRLRGGLGATGFVVAYSGNLGRAHDYMTMATAAELLAGDDVTFVMIGGGAGMQALREWVGSRRLPNVRFLGYQPRESLADSMAAADVHLVSLLPELEGLIVPSKLYGIMAAGRPVAFVGDPDGDVAGVLREFNCGFAVRPGDAAALALRLRSLASDPQLRARLGSNARRAFEQHFDRPAALQRWSRLLDQSGT